MNNKHEQPERDSLATDPTEADNDRSEQRLRSYQDKVLSAISYSAKKKQQE